MKRLIMAISLLVFCGSAFSQTTVRQFLVSAPYKVNTPFMSDSSDVNNKKYDVKNLLQNNMSMNEIPASVVADADEDGKIHLDSEGEYSLSIVSFYINSDHYSKGKLEVSAPFMFHVYVDGEKMKSEKNVSDTVYAVKNDLELLPQRCEVQIKCLLSSKDTLNPTLSADVRADNKNAVITAGADLKMHYTILNMLNGKSVYDVSMSNNGKYSMIRVSDTKEGNTERYTMLLESASGKLLSGNSDWLKNAHWMPVSNKLYYVTKNNGKRSFVTVDPVTMVKETVCENIPDGHFVVSPDEKTLLYSIMEKGPDADKALKRFANHDDIIKGWRNRYNIFKFDLTSGNYERLTYGNRNMSVNSISHDGRYLILTYSVDNDTLYPFSFTNVFIMDLQTSAIDTLFYNEPYLKDVEFSPDDSKLMIFGGPEALGKIGFDAGDEPVGNDYDTQIFIYDIANKEINPITKHFNPSVGSAVWNGSDNMLYVLATDKDCQHIFRMDPENGKYVMLDIPEDMIARMSVAKNSSELVCAGQSLTNADRVYYYNAKKQKTLCILDLSAEKLKDVELGEVKDWNFNYTDGTEITGFYCLPPDFDNSRKYPLIVYYYGGTTPTQRKLELRYSVQMFAAQGYVVYALNPSGTVGYGQEFSARHVNAWGDPTADEIIYGSKLFCRQHSFVDSTKVGCIGASYGGFMTQYLQTKTDFFAAAVSHAGISDLANYWGIGNWGPGYCSVANAGTYPWNDPDFFTEHSPLYNADKITTPLLLLHGNSDTNVPVGNSIQLYSALKILGRPVELILVDGEDHHINKYENHLQWHRTILAWFAKWLQDDDSWWQSMYPDRNL